MKRTRHIALGLMLGTAGMVLSGCEDDPEVAAKTFASVDACAADASYSWEACNEAFTKAKAEHEQYGPRYESKALCEEEFGPGQCETGASGGSSFFMPFMTGYLVSEVLDGIGDAAKKKRYAKPVYRSKDGEWLGSSGVVLRPSTSGVTLPRSVVTSAPKSAPVFTKTTVRSSGGFGSAGRSSFGG